MPNWPFVVPARDKEAQVETRPARSEVRFLALELNELGGGEASTGERKVKTRIAKSWDIRKNFNLWYSVIFGIFVTAGMSTPVYGDAGYRSQFCAFPSIIQIFSERYCVCKAFFCPGVP